MDEQKEKLTVGALLHDIGKVVFRASGEKKNHSESGCDYLKETIGINDREVLDCVRFHHGAALKNADISEKSLAYIVYQADNIASATDRRSSDDGTYGFDPETPLQPVFNILNGNKGDCYYAPSDLRNNGKINFPTDTKKKFDRSQYGSILNNISSCLKERNWTREYVNSLLEVLEANLAYVPSSTSMSEIPDISLYDHLKLTAAFACCIYDYLKEKETDDYKQILYVNGKEFFDEKAFLLYSIDVSGIQDFIYTITTQNALRTLRARSFYLEIMMEHMIDSLLTELDMSRANLIYSGGGHCYILLPNTTTVRSKVLEFQNNVNNWFMDKFQTALYIAGGYSECSGNSFQNIPDGSYQEIFKNISRTISIKKSRRYSADDINKLNSLKYDDYSRECKVCRKIGNVDNDDVCDMCRAMEKLSQKVLYGDFFSVIKGEKEGELPLPDGFTLVADTKESLIKRMKDDEKFVWAYNKNRMYEGRNIASKIWVGNYTTGSTFEEFANESKGIKRIGILRADVDNLGHAFVSGFKNYDNNDRYVTITRTSALSRQLSMFFKYYINDILANPEFTLDNGYKDKRMATIVYSGGDDVFIVGAWDDIIELSVDIQRNFEKYTEGTLTISAGIGIYQDSYPISAIAAEVADMEDKSKKLEGKNAVTIFEDGCMHDGISDGTYNWNEFQKEVLGEKFQTIYEFFETSEDHGKAFLYNMLELIRHQDDRINFARFVYLISRLEPNRDDDNTKIEKYRNFSQKMCRWIQIPKDCRQLKTAINMYTYYTREDA